MKKAQMELLGFVIVVLIISFLIVSFLIFSVKKPATSAKKIYSDKQLVANTLDVILKTDAEIRDYGKMPLGDYIRICDDKSICYEVEVEIEKNLKYVFADKEGAYYEFIAGSAIYIKGAEGCPGQRTGETIFIDGLTEKIKIEFWMC